MLLLLLLQGKEVIAIPTGLRTRMPSEPASWSAGAGIAPSWRMKSAGTRDYGSGWSGGMRGPGRKSDGCYGSR